MQVRDGLTDVNSDITEKLAVQANKSKKKTFNYSAIIIIQNQCSHGSDAVKRSVLKAAMDV